MPVAKEPQRLLRRRDAGAQVEIAPRAVVDRLEDGAPLLLEPRDRVVAADRLEPLDRLAMGAVRLGVRLVDMRRARFQFRELRGERRRVGPLEDSARGLERARDVGGDDRSLLARDLRLERVAALAVFELGGDLGQRRDGEERRHRRSLSRVDVERFRDRLEPRLRLLDRVDLLRAAARVLARPSDALLDRVGAPPDIVAGIVEIERGGDGVNLVGEQAPCRAPSWRCGLRARRRRSAPRAIRRAPSATA